VPESRSAPLPFAPDQFGHRNPRSGAGATISGTHRRRRQLEHILRDAKPDLLLPVPQAVAVAFALTNHESWKTLVQESGLTQPKAIALTITTLQATLFGRRPD
jgi:hypothetical protein